MNDRENRLEKKSDPKNRKNCKNQSEIAACEQKTTTEKPNFCSNTVFSLFCKIRAKKIHAAKPLAFSLHFLFRRDQNHYSNLTSKIMKMCEQILKKKTAPQYNSNSLNCKKQEKANNSPSYRCAAIKKILQSLKPFHLEFGPSQQLQQSKSLKEHYSLFRDTNEKQ